MLEGGLSRFERFLAALSTTLAGGISGALLVGEFLGHPRAFHQEGLGLTAPATALALLFLCSAFGALQLAPDRPAARLAASLASVTTGTAAVVLGLRNMAWPDARWDWEELLTTEASKAAGRGITHMTPAAAGMLFVASLSLLALARNRALRPFWRKAGLLAALAVAAACTTTAITILAGLPFVLGSGTRPMWFPTAAALAALGAALAVASGARAEASRLLFGDETPAADLPAQERRQRHLVIGSFFALLAAVLSLGAGYLLSRVGQTRTELAAELNAVAEYKSLQIALWYRERVSDAQVLTRLNLMVPDRRKAADVTKVEALPARLSAYLENFRIAYGYDGLTLFDRDLNGTVELSPRSGPGHAPVPELLRKARRTNDVVVGDLHSVEGGTVCMDVVAPLRGDDGTQFVGAAWLRIDTGARLFPLLMLWPSQTETAETILVRREGASLVALSPLRYRPGVPLGLSLPLRRSSLLESTSSASRDGGLLEGLDYRGVPSLGASRAVPGTPWIVLAKEDL